MRGRLVLFALVWALAGLPAAAAQLPAPTVVLVIGPFEGRIMPDTGRAELPLTLRYTCDGQELPTESHTVLFSAKAIPSYGSVIFSPASVEHTFRPGDCPPGTVHEFQSKMVVAITRDAPAFEDGKYEIEASVKRGTSPLAKTTATGVVKNDYLPLLQVQPVVLFVKADQNRKVVFPVSLSNLGNGPTRVKVDLVQSSKFRLAALNPGPEIRLESKASKGAAAVYRNVRNIEATTPDSSGLASFLAKFTAAYDGASDGPTMNDEQSIAFSVQVTGALSSATPSLPPLAAVLLLAGLVAAKRRKETGPSSRP